MRRWVRRGELDPADAEIAVQGLGVLRLHRHEHGPLRARVWELRDRCSAYDAACVALAEALQVPLLTADGRLARAAGGLIDVRLVS